MFFHGTHRSDDHPVRSTGVNLPVLLLCGHVVLLAHVVVHICRVVVEGGNKGNVADGLLSCGYVGVWKD